MSYTPEEQKIEQPARKIVEGIQEFLAAARERITHRGGWSANHLVELNAMRKRLLDLELDISLLAGLS